jgi:hypothetical protein
LLKEANKMKTVEQTTVVKQNGRWSKYSSPVFVIKVEQREANDLDEFFGEPLSPVHRERDYRGELNGPVYHIG